MSKVLNKKIQAIFIVRQNLLNQARETTKGIHEIRECEKTIDKHWGKHLEKITLTEQQYGFREKDHR